MQYTEVGRIKSHSNPNKEYKISVDNRGNLSCNCPRWIFQHHKVSGYQCKHIIEYLAGQPNNQVPKDKIPKRVIRTIKSSEIKTGTLAEIIDFL